MHYEKESLDIARKEQTSEDSNKNECKSLEEKYEQFCEMIESFRQNTHQSLQEIIKNNPELSWLVGNCQQAKECFEKLSKREKAAALGLMAITAPIGAPATVAVAARCTICALITKAPREFILRIANKFNRRKAA